MNLLHGALRKPITVVVAVLAILFFSVLTIQKMKIDIFPTLGLPTIYVAQPYGGLSPDQMEGLITSYYEYHFLYVTGVKFVESRSIQWNAIIKIQFQEDTDMSQAMAEIVGYVNRSRAFMPPGTVPPFITRYQVQVEYPQFRVNSTDEIEMIPVSHNSDVYLRDVAQWKPTLAPGEYNRLNQRRFITLTANIHGEDLGTAIHDVNSAVASLGQLPKDVKVVVKGQADLLRDTMNELQSGLIIAIVVIFLLIATNFQSFRLSAVTLSIVHAVIAGSLLLLWITGKTLNIQSYMGMIMAVGVAIANAILFISNAEGLRKGGSVLAYREGAFNRLRPIVMTSLAMIAGMVPMSLGFGEGSDQVAPLGIAVIGGLIFSLVSTLLFLPVMYQAIEGKRAFSSASLDPDDQFSKYFKA
jgi:multidrug efflux pump subunit AcrB